tara:strand:+ start:1292 stop:3883 length:2592 start_codon:yes stop_codon:yes gene_type:complete
MSFFTKLFFSIIFFISSFTFAQSQEDLEFLGLLPENQAQSITSKLGIQTGKPINDDIRMDDFDVPSFNSSKPKISDNDISDKTKLDSFNGNKVFGLDLFKESPSTFAPIDLAPAPMDYTLGPGDELKIQLFGSIQINRIIPVNREGNIIIPEIGSIEISGLNFQEAKNKINSVISASLIGVNSEISLAKIRSIQIFVLGNAYSPGAYTVSSLSNISNVLFFSGGPSQNGSLRNISVKRDGQEIAVLDFYEFLIKGNIKNDIKLQSNDAIVINPTGKTVSISGQVKNQAQFELIKDENFSDLLSFSSGFTNKADKKNITLSSYAENGERVYLNYTLSEIINITLKDGDEIFIHSLPNTPRNVVKIVGEISASGSVAFEPKLTLEDLIKPEDFYESTYAPFAIIERESNYGSKSLLRTNLYNNDGSITKLKPNDIIYVLSKKDVAFLNSVLVADALGILKKKESEELSDYFKRRNLDRFQCKSLQMLAKQSSSSSIKFVKSKYLPNPDIEPIDQLEFVDACPKIFEAKPYLIMFTLENSSVISGEIRNPGIYPSYNIASISDLLSYAGGASDKFSGNIDLYTDDGISLKLNGTSKKDLIELGVNSGFYANLSSKIQNDIFSISLEGAFKNPGVYGAQQGDRLSEVIKRAGGYKSNAFPYGGILARKSVAEKEKIAFIKSADQLEQSIATAISSGRISSVGGDPTLALTSISRLITDLENIDPIGRVVTELDIDTLEKYPERDILLEPGDRIFIPDRPSTITVSGQVLSPTSFTFNPTFKVKDYINQAGGYSEEADKNRTLIIYPNGMASRVRTWPNSPDLAPGTSLIVPRDPNPFDWLVFSQVLFPIISNFATSAAAIAALGNNN